MEEAKVERTNMETKHKSEMNGLVSNHKSEIEKLNNDFATKESEIKSSLSTSQNASVAEIESLKKTLEATKTASEKLSASC